MKKLLITGILALVAFSGYGQGMRDVVINEILVRNVNNYEDDYGHREAWIELFNAGYSSTNVASSYLAMKIGDETISYRIPKNDKRTIIAPQEYTVFFCEGTQTKGTFHTNLTFDLNETGDTITVITPAGDTIRQPKVEDQMVTIALLEANGRDTIDKVTFNVADQIDDISIGRTLNEEGEVVFEALGGTTPYATNITVDTVPNHELFRRSDPIGYGMALTAMFVVLTALLLLYLVFRTLGKLMQRKSKETSSAGAGTPATPAAVTKAKGEVFSGADLAAITMALHMYQNDLHDQESAILTINRVAKAYSPWNSKLYGMRQLPDKTNW